MNTNASELLELFSKELSSHSVSKEDDIATRGESWLSSQASKASAILLPKSSTEVSFMLKHCHQAGQKVVPYGGGTGLVGGALANDGEFLLTLERMRVIEEIDSIGRTAIVQSGVTLQQLQEAVEDAGLIFPLDLGARGSATIGGNISTNAGGNRVIRYGMMRDMVLGLEVVLADGTVVSSMNRLIKNNTGYDLKQLFIGAEGTLGVITKAVLRLREKPISQNVALVAVDTFSSISAVLKHVDRKLGGMLSAFEVMWRDFYETVTDDLGFMPPLHGGYGYYILIESQGSDEEADRRRLEDSLSQLVENGLVVDAVVSTSQAQSGKIWRIRDGVEVLLKLGPIYMFDVSLPIQYMENYVKAVRSSLTECWSNNRCIVWGHLGDCNLHIWITVFDQSDEIKKLIESIVYGPLSEFDGSISAEHGIGSEKRPYLGLSRSEPELALMRQIKQLLDPNNILNPGKIF